MPRAGAGARGGTAALVDECVGATPPAAAPPERHPRARGAGAGPLGGQSRAAAARTAALAPRAEDTRPPASARAGAPRILARYPTPRPSTHAPNSANRSAAK